MERQVAILLSKFNQNFSFLLDSDELSYKLPMIVGIILIYLATIFVGITYKLPLKTTITFTIIMLVHLLLYLCSDFIFKHRYWLYFCIQGIIIFSCALVVRKGYQPVLLGLIPILICQSIVVYYNTIKLVITFFFFCIIFSQITIMFDGQDALVHSIPILIIIIIAILAYSTIFVKQVKLRIQTQKILQELELAYEKVEELTLVNERQRMARDLHDILSQGVAGLIMQLEAVDANLKNNNTKRAQEIVQKSMEHARKTLSDSRLIINDLRFHKSLDIDFTNAVENEIAAFKAISDTSIKENIKVQSQINPKMLKHILYIVREALNNIAKHAEAKNASVEIVENSNELNINITDDGIGFDVKLLNRLFGHYGILGMTERLKELNGKIKIKSKKNLGTNLDITIPIKKGINKRNE